MNDFYDVIIVGAGPGGLACAKELGLKDLKVLVLEKNKIIGPKVCAGCFRGIDFVSLGLDESYMGCLKNDKNACTVDRRVLGEYQLSLLDGFDNVFVKSGVKVLDIFNDKIVVDGFGEVGFKYLVGADGSLSVVRKYLGLNTKRFLVTLQYVFPIGDSSRDSLKFKKRFDKFKSIYMEYPKFLFPWYVWICPFKDCVRVGCGCARGHVADLKKKFDKWLRKNKIDVKGVEVESFIINCDFQGYRFGDVFLVGDAAGLASYITGEGIHQALISGTEVAKMILDKNYKSFLLEQLIDFKCLSEDVFLEKLE